MNCQILCAPLTSLLCVCLLIEMILIWSGTLFILELVTESGKYVDIFQDIDIFGTACSDKLYLI